MAKYRELYFRYLKTCSLNKILKPLKNEDILSLSAWRSKEDNRIPANAPLWFRSHSTERLSMVVDFNSLSYGGFEKAILRENMNALDVKDAVVKSLDVNLGDHSKEIGEALAKEYDEPSLASLPYIAHFEEHPCSQEDGENLYIREVKAFMKKEIKRYGFKTASVDFAYVLPVNIWRETTRARKLSNEYLEMMEGWKARMRQMDHSIIRKTALKIFPKGMQSGRIYRLTTGDRYELSRIGDF